jgi:hypothetical protein
MRSNGSDLTTATPFIIGMMVGTTDKDCLKRYASHQPSTLIETKDPALF